MIYQGGAADGYIYQPGSVVSIPRAGDPSRGSRCQLVEPDSWYCLGKAELIVPINEGAQVRTPSRATISSATVVPVSSSRMFGGLLCSKWAHVAEVIAQATGPT